ncbi:MAG: restriction endonuclease [Deltaproteobacteria bacterium]|nr:restriction endonuclease [Deltaproteobacteria bacterium]
MDNTIYSECIIGCLAKHVDVVATSCDLKVRYVGNENGINLAEKSSWDTLSDLTSQGKYLSQSIESLVAQGLVDTDNKELFIKYDELRLLNDHNADFVEGLVPWAPFSILIQSSGVLGTPSFKMTYRFMLGNQHSFPVRLGPFLIRGEAIYRLSPSNYETIEGIDRFNNEAPENKNKENALRTLAHLRILTAGEGFDEYLASEDVIIPQKVKVDIASEGEGYISLYPTFGGVSGEAFRKEFFRLSAVQKVYDVQPEQGKRVRVVIPDEMIPVLTDIQKVRRVGGATRDRVIADVMSCFSDGVDRDLIDITEFAPRVKGICTIPERASLLLNIESRGWDGISDGLEAQEAANGEKAVEKPLVLSVSAEEGNINMPLSFKEFREFARSVAEAQEKDSAQILYRGQTIYTDDKLLSQINELEATLEKKNNGKLDIKKEAKQSLVLNIYQNIESTNYSEGTLDTLQALGEKPALPVSLKKSRIVNESEVPIVLKKHQEQGVLWLQNLFINRLNRRGGLLADDMGLGKTLQILTFLAWCIETGYSEELGKDRGPYEPILIVSPIILLDVWQKEINRYFGNGVFDPTLILYGPGLKEVSLSGISGRETKDAKQKLDLDKIRLNRVVITNYDTIKNYQHSLAKVPWSIVVTDEAQEFKIQNQTSDALKALKAQFRIVATGTPVENRLLDLWNLVDFMQAGSLLGSAKEFYNKFEKDVHLKSPEEKKELTKELRKALCYDRADAYVLRRDKENELTELKSKIEHKIICPMDTVLKKTHIDIVKNFKEEERKKHHFTLIHSLKRLYLHPRLLNGPQPVEDVDGIIKESGKLQKMIEVLEGIKEKKEKVLIFARSCELQTILSEVLGTHFDLRVDVINGSNVVDRKKIVSMRQNIINQFEAKEGFNVLLLSPEVAGVGLTITGANHVVHFERWWNPAKESQATDRAYRIGQTRDVHVYYFIVRDESREVISFDETLDNLLTEKQTLAKDFLIPRDSIEISQEEIIQGLSGKNDLAESPTVCADAAIKTLADVDRLPPHQFEALVGLIHAREGKKVILCPLVGDGGADLLVVGKKDLVYVQCKHSSCLNIQTSRAIRDLEEAHDVYRREVLPESLRRRPPILEAWTNSRFDQDTRAMATRNKIHLIEGKDLSKRLEKINITKLNLIEFETERTRNLKDIKERASLM